MEGTLNVTLPAGPLELNINFVDRLDCQYFIRVALLYLFHRSAKGKLMRGKVNIGEVDLRVNWNHLRNGLPLIW